MSEKKRPTIWMNVTTSANWQRPAVGIVRVERALSEELSKLYGSQFRRCVWQGKYFVEWTPDLQRDLEVDFGTQSTAMEINSRKSDFTPIFPILSRKQALISIAQGILSLLPSSLQPRFNRLLFWIRPKLWRIFSNSKNNRFLSVLRDRYFLRGTKISLRSIDNSRSNELVVNFNPDDVLISIGLDWDYEFPEIFYSLRKQFGIKIVTCCYDLIPVVYPQYCVGDVAQKFVSYFLDLAESSNLILCISNQSRKDLLEMLNRTGGAIPSTHVFPLGDNVPVISSEVISKDVREICESRFILYVSTIERRKNHEVLYRAYHLLCAQGKGSSLPKLVFVGMQGWGVSDLLKDIELDPLTQGLIVRLNHVTDNELRLLYESALFCVYPSLYEGWGLPVGEALALGKAVICSNRGSLPEVGREAVRYVDPWSPHDWAEEIYRMATDAEWRAMWEARAREQYRPRLWSDSALSVKNAIDRIME